MARVVASGALQMPTYRIFRGREGRVKPATLSTCWSLPESRRSVFAFRGRACSPASSFSGRLIAPEKKCYNKCHAGKSIVVSAKVGGAVDVVVESEALLELSSGQNQFFHRLPSGLRMEVICQKGAATEGGGGERQGDLSKAPLVFVHGSYHGAWCWAIHWMPYFAARGHDCYAISLLGQGASDVPAGKCSFSLQSHAGDIGHFIAKNLNAPLVLVGHSFGGLIVQWLLSHIASPTSFASSTLPREREGSFPRIAAAALVCSAPPTGNGYFAIPHLSTMLDDGQLVVIQPTCLPKLFNLLELGPSVFRPMVQRFLKRDLFSSIQITLSLAAKLFGSSLSLCRKSFFSADMPDADVQKYQKVLKQSSRCPMIDLQKLNASLPLPRLPPQAPPVCVLAAENDFIVDLEGAQETAEWYGTEPLVISGSAHDIMLDSAWEKAGETLQSWLDRQSL